MTLNGDAAVDCQEALGLERLAWPTAVKNEAVLCGCRCSREQEWSDPLLSTLYVRARPHSGCFHTLSPVNLIAAPCGDYCLYDTSEKETQGKVVELRFDHKSSRQSNRYFPP